MTLLRFEISNFAYNLILFRKLLDKSQKKKERGSRKNLGGHQH